MSHYFENDDKVKDEEKIIKTKVKDIDLSFTVNNGVFSKTNLDFGTRTLLETISDINGDVLDFGCGYGPIGIYIKKVYNADVDMVDINDRAISLSKKNIKLNKVNCNIFHSDIYENITKKYDYIISNPPIRVGKEILFKILLEAKFYLKENGKLIFVINKDQGAKSTMKKLEEVYNVTLLNKNKGFYIIMGEIKYK